ncbi:MAG: N-acetyl-gamma-glutamyl-phosphate reductase [Candidatus Obscuribacterales bacterium]|nr:N-acetyl-gamma-glutamyl-phosphate reductase [Candidatus Obscuribacterales bacterium]
MLSIGIAGATGYTGQELVRFLLGHRQCRIECLSSRSYSGQPYSSVFPHFKGIMDKKCIDSDQLKASLKDLDILFLALPHGLSADLMKEIDLYCLKVIDLGADFRLKEAGDYKIWYQLEHSFPEALSRSVYGLSEWRRDQIKEARLVANPGCYATASELALMPLAEAGLLADAIIDAKSGVSGAGRSPVLTSHFNECNENIKAYKVAAHRHIPEIEQELSRFGDQPIKITFTPHLIPMQRGILTTSYCNIEEGTSFKQIKDLYMDRYDREPFVRLVEDESAQTRYVRGSNYCDISINLDRRTNRLIITSALDNLVKGAAGQAIQNMNIMSDLDETLGLSQIPMLP